MRRLLLAMLGLLLTLGAQADDGLVVAQSAHSVAETLNRFARAAEAKGMKIFARIDHAAGAEAAGMPLPATELLIFGNPRIGTTLMRSNRRIGVDLPLKAMAWQDEAGAVWLAFPDPATLLERYGISDQAPIAAKMTQALAGFALQATAP